MIIYTIEQIQKTSGRSSTLVVRTALLNQKTTNGCPTIRYYMLISLNVGSQAYIRPCAEIQNKTENKAENGGVHWTSGACSNHETSRSHLGPFSAASVGLVVPPQSTAMCALGDGAGVVQDDRSLGHDGGGKAGDIGRGTWGLGVPALDRYISTQPRIRYDLKAGIFTNNSG